MDVFSETLIKRKEYLSYVLEIIKKTPSDTKIDLEFLKDIEKKDCIFPDIDYKIYM